MGMLGNSSRGLLPLQKRLLYRSCVIPIATYGFRLWFFAGAPTKAQVLLLAAMQRKAALWIRGAFCTSPTGGIEALAGFYYTFFPERLEDHCPQMKEYKYLG